MTVADDITALSAADAAVASAAQAVTAAQANLAAAQAQVVTAQAADVTAEHTVSSDLKAGGPVFVQNTDGSVDVYLVTNADSLGYQIVHAQPAASVPSATPPPTT